MPFMNNIYLLPDYVLANAGRKLIRCDETLGRSPQTFAKCPCSASCSDAAHDKRTKREKERPERAASSQPRATPWVSVYKRLRPVRAKVWANG